jgi:hypothetical protein
MAIVEPFENSPPLPLALRKIVTVQTNQNANVRQTRRWNRSAEAGNTRQRVSAFWKPWRRSVALAKILPPTSSGRGDLFHEYVMNVAPVSPQRQYFFGWFFNNNHAQWLAAQSAFFAMPQAARAAWQSEAVAGKLKPTHFSYASDPEISAGLTLFIFATGLEALDPPFPRRFPNAVNHSYWGDWFRNGQPAVYPF